RRRDTSWCDENQDACAESVAPLIRRRLAMRVLLTKLPGLRRSPDPMFASACARPVAGTATSAPWPNPRCDAGVLLCWQALDPRAGGSAGGARCRHPPAHPRRNIAADFDPRIDGLGPSGRSARRLLCDPPCALLLSSGSSADAPCTGAATIARIGRCTLRSSSGI